MRGVRFTAATAVLVVAGGMTLSCGSSTSEDGQDAAARDELTVGIKFDQPGLGEMGADGEPTGFDVDVARYIAAELGVPDDGITWREVPSAEREEMIDSGQVDLVVATYSITMERKQKVAFAGPYFLTGQDLLVKVGDTDIQGPGDLDGKAVCTAAGSTSAEKIRQDFSDGVRLATEATYSQCVDALLEGTVDAVSTDDVILAGYAAQRPEELRVVGHTFTRERYGVGVNQDDPELQEAVTAAIEQMIDDGSWQESLERHVGPSGYPLPEPPRVFHMVGDVEETAAEPADPELLAATERLADEINAHHWAGVIDLTCESYRPQLEQIIEQLVPKFDTNIPPEVTKKIGHQFDFLEVRQSDPATGIGFAQGVLVNVPAEYDEYFLDGDYTITMEKQDESWLMCGVAAEFEGDF